TFMAEAGDLRRKALSLDVRASAQAEDDLKVSVRLKNRAGHGLPSGFPGRQVVVTVRAEDAAGATQAQAQRVFARKLVDAQGAEVPFHRAVNVAEDSRLASRETR